MAWRAGRLPFFVLLVAVAGCGSRTGAEIRQWDAEPGPMPRPEVCNGLDDDLDGLVRAGVLDGGDLDGSLSEGGVSDGGGRDASVDAATGRDAGADGGMDGGPPRDAGPAADAGPRPDGGRDAGPPSDLDLFVDEDFRDSMGRYVDVDHCGECGHACRPSRPHERTVGCGLVAESPVCVALTCDPGWVPSRSGVCVPAYDRLCLTCADDGDCGDFDEAHCIDLAGERRCVVDCSLSCPDGYVCSGSSCTPPGGSCSCEPGASFTIACALMDPMGNRCPGSSMCMDGVVSPCASFDEVCDHVDNDCNGTIDDGYRDGRGAYILDIHNCGECGVDCTESTIPEGDLVCGGDPFAPSCVLHCPDTDDGIQPGDRVDANRDIADGCECTVTSPDDVPGPVRTSGQMLDVNCDGADGVVIHSFYVAPDGNDTWPGSPTRPLRTLAVALMRASDSLDDPETRPHVFVASGTYAESVELPDGVIVHGGYRRDFLALDPDGFRVEIRAPQSTTAPGGAALVVRGAGTSASVTGMEWLTLRGRDAVDASSAAFGAVLIDPGQSLFLRDMTVIGGVAGSGASGMEGMAGRAFATLPGSGDPPRGAIEDFSHACTPVDANRVRGGAGGTNSCGGVDTSGGAGGVAACPVFAMQQGGGTQGRGVGTLPGGSGGMGGQDSTGPITSDTGACPSAPVCCGLADFTVPGDGFLLPDPGRPGRDGTNGRAGTACTEALGRFDGERWVGIDATGGTAGTPGSGGGGGGAGGGTAMDWFDGLCEFPDGLGGGGGGGGAGGCGGAAGSGGTSGAPSVAILVRYTRGIVTGVPAIAHVRIAPSEGGRGGDGGAGGDGGSAANGAFGIAIPLAMRSTPTLAGPFEGGRGGAGGNGGSGGGGGGGCGGASVGIWVTGVLSEPGGIGAWRTGNTFQLGRAGTPGRGGGGSAPGPDGAAGGAMDVVVR